MNLHSCDCCGPICQFARRCSVRSESTTHGCDTHKTPHRFVCGHTSIHALMLGSREVRPFAIATGLRKRTSQQKTSRKKRQQQQLQKHTRVLNTCLVFAHEPNNSTADDFRAPRRVERFILLLLLNSAKHFVPQTERGLAWLSRTHRMHKCTMQRRWYPVVSSSSSSSVTDGCDGMAWDGMGRPVNRHALQRVCA